MFYRKVSLYRLLITPLLLASLDVTPWRQLLGLSSSDPLWCSIFRYSHGCWFFLSQLLLSFFIIPTIIVFPYYYYHSLYVLFLAKIKHIYPLGFMISILIVRHYHTVGFSSMWSLHYCIDAIPFSLSFQPTQLVEVGVVSFE
jgi:hypothetical protein